MFSRPQPCVLIVDDDDELRAVISEHLSSEGFAVAQAATGADAQDRLKGFAYDGLVIDLKLPDANGLEILDVALTRYPEIVAVVMTGYGGVEDAVAAIKRGAIDFFVKPVQLPHLSRVLAAAVNEPRLRRENAELRAQLRDRYRFDNVIGQSTTIQTVFKTLELVAPMNSTVLIQGETGTGKELIARTIHHNSPRADQRFVAFNAAAIPESLAEAELFGHAKGAFTGAIASRVGRFELAHRGTLFIDEVAADEPAAAGQAAARAAGARDRACRGVPSDQVRCARRRGDEHGTEEDGEGGHLPRGSLLPSERHPDHACRRCAIAARMLRSSRVISWRSRAGRTTCR